MADKEIKKTEGLPQPPPEIVIAETKEKFDWKRVFFILLGLGLFLWIYYYAAWPDAIDPGGKHFVLSPQGKGAIALFLLASTWWIFEVVTDRRNRHSNRSFSGHFCNTFCKGCIQGFYGPVGHVYLCIGCSRCCIYKNWSYQTSCIQNAPGCRRKNKHDRTGSTGSHCRTRTCYGTYRRCSYGIPDTSRNQFTLW